MPRLAVPCVLALALFAPPAAAQELAFVSERDAQPTEIYAIGADGTNERNLSQSPEPDDWPDWSPDGAQIAFGRGFGSDADIWVMAADGSAQRRLTDATGPDRAPDWSPDGRRIAFVSERSGGAELHVMNADGSGVVQLTQTGGVASAPAWSPDGTRLAYWREDAAQLWVVGADGGGDRPLGGQTPRAERDPAWAPDGARVAFTSLDMSGSLDLFTMGADGGGAAALAPTPARETDPAWSADGIAFASDRVNGDLDVWVMAADGTGQRRVTMSSGDDSAPDWRPRPPSFTGALPPQGGTITVGVPPATAPGSRRRRPAPATGSTVRLTMGRSTVRLEGRQLVVRLRFLLSAPTTGTFRVVHRGRVVASKLHRGRRGLNVVRITRRVHDPKRWNGEYRLSVVNLRRRG